MKGAKLGFKVPNTSKGKRLNKIDYKNVFAPTDIFNHFVPINTSKCLSTIQPRWQDILDS